MLLGCIGDDFTGSSDLANTLARQGMRTVQYSGIPDAPADAAVEAGVIALKSRAIEVAQAVHLSLEALEWLQAQGCRQFFFKYCSTFDSTPAGNIGPVTEALANALDADRVIVCPAFPGTGRSVYQGHLFVNDTLLSESGMQNHPQTPMTDPDLRRWLALQASGEVGHVPISSVFEGPEAVQQALAQENSLGRLMVVVDALRDEDLMTIGEAADELKLLSGGSGVALGLPENFRKRGELGTNQAAWSGEHGQCVALSGSCSVATRAQVKLHAEQHPAMEIRAEDVICGRTTPTAVCDWLMTQSGIPLAYSSADPDTVAKVQQTYGRETAANALESFFATVARGLVARGLNRLIIAGGETSGAVVESLHLNVMEIGPEIDPGVPAMRADENLVFTLKSGNFGAPDFFSKAANVLAGT